MDDEMVRVIMHMKESGIKEGFVDIRKKTCSCSVFQVVVGAASVTITRRRLRIPFQ